MRRKIYQMVHKYEGHWLSVAYRYFMVVVIIASLVPLTMRENYPIFRDMELVCAIIYVVDYALRWISADYKFDNHHWTAFVKYPFRLISLIDLASILALLSSVFGLFVTLRIAKLFTVCRVVRIFRYFKGFQAMIQILKRSRKALAAVGGLAVGYIVVSAIIMFHVEPDLFHNFFDAVYWSTISLTTVGYGDLCPVTLSGKIIAVVSSFFGIAIVALPAGVVTAEYLEYINEKRKG